MKAARNLIQYQLVIPTRYYLKIEFYLRIMYDIVFIELIDLLCKHLSSWSEECLKVLKPFIYFVNIYKKSRHDSLFSNKFLAREKHFQAIFKWIFFFCMVYVTFTYFWYDFYLYTRTEQKLNSLYNICKILIHIIYYIF